ncbi:hypothetical protein CYY_008986 [Polysphondylium violaceum]|uniref:Large ribosomal subunit protein bL34m n=1 Tax=Polysphondylium violaceum TaxID=133409 RepID=A0A8J4PKS3_9MYCE|nr:hypothetical protein CYY_008986 [Polysphondylium violaceum]
MFSSSCRLFFNRVVSSTTSTSTNTFVKTSNSTKYALTNTNTYKLSLDVEPRVFNFNIKDQSVVIDDASPFFIVDLFQKDNNSTVNSFINNQDEITVGRSVLDIDPLVSSLSPLNTTIFNQDSIELDEECEQQEEEGFQCLKRTYQPSVLIRKRRHGFMSRLATKGGRRVLKNRISKGRDILSA